MYKKHFWTDYGRHGTIIEIIIHDSGGERIEQFKFNNQKDYSKVLRIMKDKYGFDFKQDNLEKEKDTDFIKSDNEDIW
jgi:hypothetical protein